ncbi:hypothetical protein TrVE_jg1708 [Triparma verrucosa]|uniref:Uncharacterized protein n=1 Tax=Triparma verrucosa TaxID=1606542 RepID=A0A9W7EP82_9STRA|nr:hypothetical protein TrVE_jg1708 [Triparma verrucosa]
MALVAITALSSLYLLSALGVESDEIAMVWNVSVVGAFAVGGAFVINVKTLVWAQDEKKEKSRRTLNMLKDTRSIRTISAGAVQEGMAVGAFL